MYGILVPGTHGASRNTYPSTIGMIGSSAESFLARALRAISKTPASTARVLLHQISGLPIATTTCRSPSGFAPWKKLIGLSIIGQLHQGEPHGWSTATVILPAACTCQFHVHTHASIGFAVTLISAPT